MIVAIIQARLGSTRLPGKVLMKVGDKSLLEYLVERLLHTESFGSWNLEQLPIIAVPGCDYDAIKATVGDRPCRVIGTDDPVDDVHGRFLSVLSFVHNYYPRPNAFIRICADSPLLDPVLVDWMIEQHEGGITTNVQPRTFPAGQSIEIIDTDVFLAGKPETPEDREHVMPWYYRNCKFKNVTNPLGDFSNHRQVVDTLEDFDRIKQCIESMKRPHWSYGWRELTEIMLPATNSD